MKRPGQFPIESSGQKGTKVTLFFFLMCHWQTLLQVHGQTTWYNSGQLKLNCKKQTKPGQGPPERRQPPARCPEDTARCCRILPGDILFHISKDFFLLSWCWQGLQLKSETLTNCFRFCTDCKCTALSSQWQVKKKTAVTIWPRNKICMQEML